MNKPVFKELLDLPFVPEPLNDTQIENLERLVTSAGWKTYMEMLDVQVNMLGEKMLEAHPDTLPQLVAEIKGLRELPQRLVTILRGVENERRRDELERERDAERARRAAGRRYGSPFWTGPEPEVHSR